MKKFVSGLGEVEMTADEEAAYIAQQAIDEAGSVTASDIEAERTRRLSAGFDFDFGDDRGVHHIGTSAADMVGWQEVTMLANAYLAMEGGERRISIATDSGAAVVTPLEWQSILIAAAAFRQPIWIASFALASLDPIPNDFKEDKYWEV
jgi:hypothetical protein